MLQIKIEKIIIGMSDFEGALLTGDLWRGSLYVDVTIKFIISAVQIYLLLVLSMGDRCLLVGLGIKDKN